AVCLYAINIGPGDSPSIGCAYFVIDPNPFGSLDTVSRDGDTVHLTGWAIDPDTYDPIHVHVYIDSTGTDIGSARIERPDVGYAFNYRSLHGFDTTLTVPPGPHTLCAYAINVEAGDNVQLRCASI